MAIKISGNTIIDDSRNIIDAVDVQTTTINDGPLAGLRNHIINGNFDIWQRGISITTTGSGNYFADRWVAEDDVLVGSRTISRQAFTLGQTDVPGNPKYFLRFDQQVATSGGTFYIFGQKIEGVRTLAGQQVTFSAWVKTDSGTVNMGTTPLGYLQYFGSGGSPSTSVTSTVALTTGSTTLTTAWQLWTVTFTLPSISGKTLGTNENDSLWIGFNFPLGVAFTLDLARVQLEPGPVATPFEDRPLQVEGGLCLYFFSKSSENVEGGQFCFKSARQARTGMWNSQHNLPVPMRTSPSVTIVGTPSYNGSSNLQVVDVSQYGFSTEVDVAAAAVYRGYGWGWEADAEL